MLRLILAGRLILGSSAVVFDPSRAGQTVDRCHAQCASLLGSVKPVSEARRVYQTCRALCARKGTVIFPGGVRRRVGRRC
jgi:hypothetical protein